MEVMVTKNTDINVYLDVDGVLLANENNVALGADDLIQFVVPRYNVYWLTTHCHGDASIPVKRFARFFTPETREFLPHIRATDWQVAKTEAIDFTKPFLWFDDDLYDDERDELVSRSALAGWVEVDLSKDAEHLKHLLEGFDDLVARISR